MPTANTQYLTHEKSDELKKELEYLRAEKRKEVAEHLEYSKKLGDLSENAEYHQAREEQAEVEDRIRYIENLLKNAVIASSTGGATVTVGSTVRLEKVNSTNGNMSMLYTIVGSEEADTASGKISNVSPLGSAVIGHKVGDTVSVQTPKGMMAYKIAALS
jgi:transcription elongation factor GreA